MLMTPPSVPRVIVGCSRQRVITGLIQKRPPIQEPCLKTERSTEKSVGISSENMKPGYGCERCVDCWAIRRLTAYSYSYHDKHSPASFLTKGTRDSSIAQIFQPKLYVIGFDYICRAGHCSDASEGAAAMWHSNGDAGQSHQFSTLETESINWKIARNK